MLNKHIAVALLGTALTAAPALAQTSSESPGSSSAPMATTPPSNANSAPMGSGASSMPSGSTSGSSMSSGSASSMSSTSGASAMDSSGAKFLTQEGANQWRASKLVGVNVYGPNDAKVGDINEVIIDRDGKVAAVVIGVGGFLGIGEKNVALPYASLQWSDMPRSGRSATPNGAGSAATTSTSNSSATRGYPDHASLAMTKDDLKNAPSFKWSSDRSDTK